MIIVFFKDLSAEVVLDGSWQEHISTQGDTMLTAHIYYSPSTFLGSEAKEE